MNEQDSRTELMSLVEKFDEDDDNFADNLREHDVGDMISCFGLTREHAGILDMIVREATDHQYNTYGMAESDAEVFLETIQESMHQSFEGWEGYDRLVIRAYLADIAYATYLTKNGPTRINVNSQEDES